MVLLVLSASLQVTAQPNSVPDQCREVVADCEELVLQQSIVITELDLVRKMQDDIIGRQMETLNETLQDLQNSNEQLNSWYRNPVTVSLIGLAGGLLIGGLVFK